MTTIVEWSAADQVTDEVSFLAILKRLARDREDEVRKEVATPSHPMCPGANGWEDGSIDTYLDAARAVQCGEWGCSEVGCVGRRAALLRRWRWISCCTADIATVAAIETS